MVAVTGFTPSTKAFHFPNSWPHVAAFSVQIAGFDVPVGDASRGLCGGMVYAVRDYFEHNLPIPTEQQTPGSGPVYEYVGQRLKESFDLPLGPAKYLEYMATADGDKAWPILGWFGIGRIRGVAWRTIHDELPRILADIDQSHLSCLGLVCTQSADPLDLGENHQVLAYRYERSDDIVRLWVYDPNRPNGDEAHLRFSTAHPNKPTPIDFVNGSKTVRGFFRTAYTPKRPPAG